MLKDCTLAEAKASKEYLQLSIIAAIKAFHKQVGVYPGRIDYELVTSCSGKLLAEPEIKVTATIKIDL